MKPKILTIFFLILLNSTLISVFGQTAKRDAFFVYEINTSSKKPLRVNCYYHNDSVRTIVIDYNTEKVYDTFYDINKNEIQYLFHNSKHKLVLRNVPRDTTNWKTTISDSLTEIDSLWYHNVSANKLNFSLDFCSIIEVPDYTQMAFHQFGIKAMHDLVYTAKSYLGIVKKMEIKNGVPQNNTQLKLLHFNWGIPDSSLMLSTFNYETDTLNYSASVDFHKNLNPQQKQLFKTAVKLKFQPGINIAPLSIEEIQEREREEQFKFEKEIRDIRIAQLKAKAEISSRNANSDLSSMAQNAVNQFEYISASGVALDETVNAINRRKLEKLEKEVKSANQKELILIDLTFLDFLSFYIERYL
ncbi:hypothetical protein NF867_02565 [Solitalea sp. MAHUQ-68]|uniref:Uncharacterized protein n=1 Tax=Solitalea agri TaxID=2953739 RepID=A0A9X2JAS0_9SPHI|nr:hypothetical protein [Solitalea agri]MCO4291742.1 hypothetical protein [Solitalea agri]